MTYLEAAKETPRYIRGAQKFDSNFHGFATYDEYVICFHCPSSYGLCDPDEEEELCCSSGPCGNCWNRVIPGTGAETDVDVGGITDLVFGGQDDIP